MRRSTASPVARTASSKKARNLSLLPNEDVLLLRSRIDGGRLRQSKFPLLFVGKFEHRFLLHKFQLSLFRAAAEKMRVWSNSHYRRFLNGKSLRINHAQKRQ